GQQQMKGLFANKLSGRGVDDGATLNVNLAGGLLVPDFEDRGIAGHAFQLDDIVQSGLAQGAGIIIAVLPSQETGQHVENKPPTLLVAWFQEVKFRPVG